MKTKTTTSEIEDLIEYALNETKPDVKTKRDLDGLEIKIKRTTYRLNVCRMRRKRKTPV